MGSEAIARELLAVYESGGTIAPLTSRDGGFSINDAYAAEAEFRRLREAQGRQVVGRKAGYANKAMWRALKLETLVWAHMYDDTVHHSAGGNAVFSLAGIEGARIEPEIVFKLRSVPPAGLSAEAVLEHVEWLAIGFEIIACPYPEWKFQPADFVAAWGLHRALITGEPVAVDAGNIPVLAEQLQSFKLRLLKNGELAEEGAGRNSLRSPALCLAEFAAAVTKQEPLQPLAAGELFSSGTLTAAQPVSAGEVWRAEPEGIGLPELTLRLK